MNKNNKPVKLTVAHINDTHSYFEPQSLQLTLDIEGEKVTPFVSNGGFARIAARAKQLKQRAIENGSEFLFFHAGDCFQGTLYFSLFKGQANADMLNALELDAMTLGNHELDMGNDPVAEFLGRINFPLMSGNWDVSNESPHKKLTLKESKKLISYNTKTKAANWITKEAQGETVAIFGLSIDKMEDIANVDPDTPFMNTFETARSTVQEIQKQGINKIILVSHLGYDVDKELASDVDGISLIIGGHTHTLQGDFSDLGLNKEDDYGSQVNQTYIVQSGFHSQSIGHCDIEFSADGKVIHFSGRNELLIGRRLCIDATLQQTHDDDVHNKAAQYLRQHNNIVVCKRDPLLHTLLEDKYIPKVRKLQQEIIGTVPRDLRHIRLPDSIGGSEVAPLVAESFYHMMHSKGYSPEFAIHNAGGVRTNLRAGPVTVADIAGKLLPFAVPIGVYYLKGKDIALILEGAINNALNNGMIGTGSGSYPYTYNLDFHYNKQKPEGERIENLRIYQQDKGWQNVVPERQYMGTSSAYTMKGKEGYDAITRVAGEGTVTHYSMADCFIQFVKNFPSRLSAIENTIEQIG
ncbi:bifunctional metallophosphatase/5'-nucleotidase [Vibrio sp. HN007]|uniref:bifunctional metallophosphatase/5'-nucleotidase n=1 Tax=Vibrio iocasae TaxID=3098914 RepID=UPI0035D453E0